MSNIVLKKLKHNEEYAPETIERYLRTRWNACLTKNRKLTIVLGSSFQKSNFVPLLSIFFRLISTEKNDYERFWLRRKIVNFTESYGLSVIIWWKIWWKICTNDEITVRSALIEYTVGMDFSVSRFAIESSFKDGDDGGQRSEQRKSTHKLDYQFLNLIRNTWRCFCLWCWKCCSMKMFVQLVT